MLSKKSIANKQIVEVLKEIASLLEIKGVEFKPAAYRRAAKALNEMQESAVEVYGREGIKGLENIKGVGKSIAGRIEEYIKKGEIKRYKDLKQETAIRQIVTHYFKTKGYSLKDIKNNARKSKIIYSRYTRPAKDLLELAGSIKRAREAIDKVAAWASSRELDYAIETVFKKWPELDYLKPKEKKQRPYYEGRPMIWSNNHQKWYVIAKDGRWLEFAGSKKDIEWREE